MAACSLFGEKPAQELGIAAVYSRDPKLSSLYRKKLSVVENDGYGAPVNLYGGSIIYLATVSHLKKLWLQLWWCNILCG